MAIVEASHSILIKLKNEKFKGFTCTATAAMTIVNNDIYCIRSQKEDGDRNPVILHKICNYLGSGEKDYARRVVKTSSGDTAIALHANSITYHDHLFYMATRNDSSDPDNVIAFGSDGIIVAKYRYKKGSIATINFYEKKNDKLYFIVSMKKKIEMEYKMVYKLVYIHGEELIDAGVKFMLNIPDGNTYSIGNDSYYSLSDKQYYVTKFKGDQDPTVDNKIYQFDLSCGLSGTSNTFSPVRIIHAGALSESESKFEIEGLAIYNGVKYICTNSVDLSTNKKQTDAICKIYRTS